ncbi:prepilin-type N-terminal cleavage/methylation domain-containing protein [Pseudoalteromonas sp. J010]|uniref:type IV pilus modification PilV family protein n=1 Tax=Pseudoalteromonas sp. J010 TaxID=998465 RepID=UPI000F64F7BD|nr:prepilin-type N-terminal cleavage/methylation domain-containing protein [Pseudoalteromonas sp. J010]RRS09977.1 prepilin-type N-terminal cleavage/methylation domain-containing protein [Pseudoalteromonas sp. J010]
MQLNKGFSLIEVVVSMLVAGLMLLGLAATQLKSLQFASNSFQYTMALIHGQNAIERIWPLLCELQHNNSDLTTANPLIQQLHPIDDRFTLILPAIYSNNMQITVSWQDNRVDNPAENQVSLTASYPNVANTCPPPPGGS